MFCHWYEERRRSSSDAITSSLSSALRSKRRTSPSGAPLARAPSLSARIAHTHDQALYT